MIKKKNTEQNTNRIEYTYKLNDIVSVYYKHTHNYEAPYTVRDRINHTNMEKWNRDPTYGSIPGDGITLMIETLRQ